VKAMAKARIVETVRQWVGVECQVRFSSDSSAVIYAPSNMISTLVGRGGENVKQLQNELGGLRLSIESFDDMPDGMEQPNRFWHDDRRGGNAWDNSRRKGKSQRRKQRKK
jgi:predicted PilT family ATPase